MAEPITFGQMMLSDLLPEDLYQPGMPLNKKALSKVLGELAKRDPEKYRDTVFKLMRLGLKVGESTGGASFSLADLRTPPEVRAFQQEINGQIKDILDTTPDGPERTKRITAVLRAASKQMPETVYKAAKANGNKFTLQLEGAGRGSKGSLSNMLGGSVLVQNSAGDPIPIPITRGYSQGQSLGQYLATAYGGRSSIVQTKLSVGAGGYLSKLLQQAAHRLMVVDDDDAAPVGHDRGLLVDPDDEENVGAYLAKPVGKFEANTPITPSMLTALKRESKGKQIMIRSPIVSSSLDGGVYAKDVGIREYNRLPRRGEHVGLPSAQAIGEKVQQSALSAKHRGGAADDLSATPGLAGFDLIERLINPPKEGRGLAVHAKEDGRIKEITPAPQGGLYVKIGSVEHYVAPEFTPNVKVGDVVEAGDVLTDGIPDPAEVVRYKGIGEGRRYFVNSLQRGLKESGFPVARRNIELLSRGLIDRVKVEKPFGEFVPGSIVSYSRVEKTYRPRKDAYTDRPENMEGRFLEVPTTHLSIGTRITPNIVKHLRDAGVTKVTAHAEPLPFVAHVTRGADVLQTDPDYMTRFLGSHLQKGLLDSVHTGAVSDEDSTSFVPVRASALRLGRTPLTISTPGS